MDLSVRLRIGTVLCATGLVVALAASAAPAQASSGANVQNDKSGLCREGVSGRPVQIEPCNSGAPLTAIAPASAATGAAAPSAAGSIVCGGDMCIQTVSTTKSAARINGWANTSTFHGYMEISVPTGGGIAEFQQSPIETWPAGGKHFTFELNCYTSTYYTAQAWTYPAYDNKGTVTFVIDSC